MLIISEQHAPIQTQSALHLPARQHIDSITKTWILKSRPFTNWKHLLKRKIWTRRSRAVKRNSLAACGCFYQLLILQFPLTVNSFISMLQVSAWAYTACRKESIHLKDSSVLIFDCVLFSSVYMSDSGGLSRGFYQWTSGLEIVLHVWAEPWVFVWRCSAFRHMWVWGCVRGLGHPWRVSLKEGEVLGCHGDCNASLSTDGQRKMEILHSCSLPFIVFYAFVWGR